MKDLCVYVYIPPPSTWEYPGSILGVSWRYPGVSWEYPGSILALGVSSASLRRLRKLEADFRHFNMPHTPFRARAVPQPHPPKGPLPLQIATRTSWHTTLSRVSQARNCFSLIWACRKLRRPTIGLLILVCAHSCSGRNKKTNLEHCSPHTAISGIPRRSMPNPARNPREA